jgi:hypothetical protein
MSAEQPQPILQIKKGIQSIVSKLMSDPKQQLGEKETDLIGQISKYKVASQEDLTKLSNSFGNVLDSPAT